MPFLSILALVLVALYNKEGMENFLSMNNIKDKIPMLLFFLVCAAMTFFSYTKNLSLIPVLGLIFCFYMMAQIPAKSWFAFLVWLLLGLLIYFIYGIKNSKLATEK